MIGVIGGMGPLATADFFFKVLAATDARRDEDHVPLLIQSDPRIPGRPAAILHHGPSPLPLLRASRDRLITAGALALAMPCNTAHHWIDELRQDCSVPFLSIVEASCDALAALAEPGSAVGIVATGATLSCRMFDDALSRAGYLPLLPDQSDMQSLVLPAIALVKSGNAQQAGPLVQRAVENLRSNGARAVLLACTETPVALDAIASPARAYCIDSTAALARRCVKWWQVERLLAPDTGY